MTSKKYTVEQRAEAAALMVCHGNSLVVSEMVGVPASTLRHWRQNDTEFQSLCEEIRVEFGQRIQGQLSEIIEKAHDQTLDRLENGDEVHTAEGIKRIKMRGRDTATVAASAYDKLRLSQNQPTTIKADSSNVKALAEQFAALSQQWQEKQTAVIAVQENED